MKNTITAWLIASALFFSINTPTQASSNKSSFSAVEATRKPVVYSYWAGWSNASIPDFKFDGLFLSFAMLHSNNGTYYTDYSLSGNFHDWGGNRYIWDEKWWLKYWGSGARAYLSYGGGTNSEFRRLVFDANDQQLDLIAGEIKANISKYSFDGVDLDIENWWSHSRADNEKFARRLGTLVKILRKSLDNDPATFLKPIMIAVGITAADQSNPNDNYAGTMNPFFNDSEAMNAISDVNIMSYNTGYANFYARLDLFDIYLNHFKDAGVPAEKLIVGVQPCESSGLPPHTPLEVVTNLGQYVKQRNYGGLFLWGIGAGELCGQGPEHYIRAMQNGLGLN